MTITVLVQDCVKNASKFWLLASEPKDSLLTRSVFQKLVPAVNETLTGNLPDAVAILLYRPIDSHNSGSKRS